MNSLKQKYFFLNGICAFVSIAAIAILYHISNTGFRDLVGISAKNLSAIYTAGELKSLVWREMSDGTGYHQGKVSEEALQKSTLKVTTLVTALKNNTDPENRALIEEFIRIHEEIFHKRVSIGPQGMKNFSAEERAELEVLYNHAFEKLTEYGELILLGSQEQQGQAILGTTRMMKGTLIGAIGFTFLILLLSFLYLRKFIVNPIVRISSASLRAARGELSAIHEIDSDDEIGVLAKNFNFMMGEIRRSSEAVRAERDTAEKANKAKSVFLANMSHELRTPMHGILSFSKFGQQKIETATKEKLRSYFDEIYESGSRLMVLLNDILDLSKLEAGKITYSVEEGNLAETVQVVASEMKAFADEKGLQLEINHQGPVMGRYDNLRIMQVVRNILGNAIKFSEKGSTVRAELIQTQDMLSCRICNKGIGIPKEELASIFDKFAQSSKTRTGAGGTGLGLAICKEIVEQHGGKIWAESDLNGDTKFIFELPKGQVTA